MKNIALIKSIVATSISSANPAEHIAALIQAHPEETLTTSIYLGEIRDRFFLFYQNI